MIDDPEYYANRIKVIEAEENNESIFGELSHKCFLGYLAFAYLKVFGSD